MTYEQFWEQDVCLVKYYRKAFRRRQERKNHDLWLQGVYFCDAINACFSDGKSKVTYPEEPYSFSPPKGKRLTKEQQSDNKAKAAMEMFMVNINKKFERKGGGENGS